MDVAGLLPPRSVEDILAERVRLTIGGQEYVLPSLTIDDNERWLAGLEAEFAALMSALDDAGDDMVSIVNTLTGDTDRLIDRLTDYDVTGVLPDRAAIRAGLTPIGLLRAVGSVWRAANPKVDIALAGLMTPGLRASVSRLPTSRRSPSTASPRAKSAAS